MPRKEKPRAGSMAFYPRVKAKSIIPKFSSYNVIDNTKVKPVCYYGVKVGMTHVLAKNAHKNSSTYGQEIVLPVSVIETPDMKVVGARFYKNFKSTFGKKSIFEFLNQDNLVNRLIKGKKSTKKIDLNEALKRKDEADDLVLLAYLDQSVTSSSQKKPTLVEINLSGEYDAKIEYLKEKYLKTISLKETFDSDIYLDVKSISKGHGTTGPVKRFGIKVHRPKAQQIQRHVGSIGPWHPATIMFTVPRAGQYGFHNRTSYNKKLLIIDNNLENVNVKAGFKNYGLVKNDYAVIAGNIPGPSKRVVVLRASNRPVRTKTEVTDIKFIK